MNLDEQTVRQDKPPSELERLKDQRHALANQITVMRLTADMLTLELVKLDKRIKELKS